MEQRSIFLPKNRKAGSEKPAIRGIIRYVAVSGLLCQRQKSGSRPKDHVQDPDLCLFSKHLFFQKDRNRLPQGYQLHVVTGRSEGAGSQYDRPVSDRVFGRCL